VPDKRLGPVNGRHAICLTRSKMYERGSMNLLHIHDIPIKKRMYTDCNRKSFILWIVSLRNNLLRRLQTTSNYRRCEGREVVVEYASNLIFQEAQTFQLPA
jgi:hypothetical protein